MSPSRRPALPARILAASVLVVLVAAVSSPVTAAADDGADGLRRAVITRVDHDGLQLGSNDTRCKPGDVTITFDPIPASDIETGGYPEPLFAPDDGDGTRATGIVLCDSNPTTVTGFDAWIDDGGWTVRVLPIDDHGELPTAASDRSPGKARDAAELVPSSPGLAAATSSVPVPDWPGNLATNVDPLADYDGQDTCSSTVQPGTAALAELLTNTYSSNQDWYSLRDCGVGGRSEHKDGRALDWFVDAYDADERAVGDRLTRWLTEADDPQGNPHGAARRMGVMYVIWNRQVWSSWRAEDGWRTYTGSHPHDNHVHVSLSWDGARCDTTWWLATNCSGDTPSTTDGPDQVLRVHGSANTATSARMSATAFGRADTAVVARVDVFADALAAGSLAAAVDGPVLLTQTDYLPYSIANELVRLDADKVYVVGGPEAVSTHTVDQIEAYVPNVERVSGANRYQTATRVAGETMSIVGSTNRAILARGDVFADALASANLAARANAPVLLTRPKSLPPVTAHALTNVVTPGRVWLVGGTEAISDSVAAAVHDLELPTTRLAGANRYATALKIAARAESWGTSVEPTVLARGDAFQHAAAGGPAAAGMGGRILLVRPSGPNDNDDLLARLESDADALDTVFVMGDQSAVPASIDDAVLDAIR